MSVRRPRRRVGDPHRVRVDELAATDARPSPCGPTAAPRAPWSPGRRPPACAPAPARGRATARRPRSPYSAARCTVRSTSAVCSSSLAGMHPRCRHVPPTRRSSTIAMFSPAAAPYSAVAYPAGPPPRTTMSNSSPRAIASCLNRLHRSSRQQDLDRASCEDGHSGDGREDEQHPGTDAPIQARDLDSLRTQSVPIPPVCSSTLDTEQGPETPEENPRACPSAHNA